ncbi:MAG: hypothetical protein ACJAT5_000067 [Lentimonas sp.]|jgi:hypothetical protein
MTWEEFSGASNRKTENSSHVIYFELLLQRALATAAIK